MHSIIDFPTYEILKRLGLQSWGALLADRFQGRAARTPRLTPSRTNDVGLLLVLTELPGVLEGFTTRQLWQQSGGLEAARAWVENDTILPAFDSGASVHLDRIAVLTERMDTALRERFGLVASLAEYLEAEDADLA